MKENDRLKVSPDVSGKYGLRVCLNELACLQVPPSCVISAVCNEWDTTGSAITAGIQSELEANGYGNVPVNGSTEENFATSMTAFGITVIGFCSRLHWRGTKDGDFLYSYGIPYVGKDVIEHEEALLTPKTIKRLFKHYEIGDFLPCGSQGIAHEIEVLSAECGILVNVNTSAGIDIHHSAGPATCGIFTSPVISLQEKSPRIVLLGKCTKGERIEWS
jgi:hypothetical protein